MSASSTPTLSPMSRKPSARLTAVVDLPTPPLPDATAMMAFTPSGARAGLGAAGGPGGAAGSRARHHGRLDPRHRAHRRLGSLAHRLPARDRRGVHVDGEEHLAVGR